MTSRSSLRKHLILLILSLLAIIGNMVNVSLLFGVNLIFGSIFTLVILKMFGFRWAILATAVSSAYTWVLWNHPHAILFLVAEILVIGLLQRKNNGNLVLQDSLFWIVLGMPLVWWSYHHVLHMNYTASLLVLFKDAVNGVLNTIIASLIVTYVPIRQWTGMRNHRSSASFYEILFNIFVTITIISMLSVTIIMGRGQFNHMEDDILEKTQIHSEAIHHDIKQWRDEQVKAIQMLSTAASEAGLEDTAAVQQQTNYLKQLYPDFISLYVSDKEGTTVVFNPLVNEKDVSTIGLNFSDRTYYQVMKKTLLPVISEVFNGRGAVSEPIVTIGSPVLIDQQFAGVAIGALNLKEVENRILGLAGSTSMRITIVDSNKQVIASTRNDLAPMAIYDWSSGGKIEGLQNGVYHWFPASVKNPMNRWAQSSYFKVMAIPGITEWTIIAESPIAPYRDELYLFYIKMISILFSCSLVAILLIFVISRSIVRPLTRLTQTTTDLPDKIAGNVPVRWPGSFMDEVNVLIDNFKVMAGRIQKMFQEIQHLAYHDSLTGLPNRLYMLELLKIAMEHARMRGHSAAVLFIDLDRFKVINDTLGHAKGDLLIVKTAERLRVGLGDKVLLSRMGGDEFVVALSGMSTEEVTNAARHILQTFALPFDLDDNEVYITPSIGISLYPDHGGDPETLLKNADQAMYTVKEAGSNGFQFYTPDLDKHFTDQLEMETNLHKALQNHEFQLYYQPRIELEYGKVVGLEALIRWHHPVQGIIPPSDFIPMAEETGLIDRIGEWVLRTACLQNQAWQDAGYPPVPVSVNLSVRQFMGRNLVNMISEALAESGMDPRYLELEITENISMHNVERTVSVLQEIKEMGIAISIDDFGTGHSSLSYLRKYPIDYLKIDQSFIRGIQGADGERSIVKAIITMAHSIGLTVIAEGVETEEQFYYLRELGCNEIQGYLISKPLPSGELLPFLTEKATFLPEGE